MRPERLRHHLLGGKLLHELQARPHGRLRVQVKWWADLLVPAVYRMMRKLIIYRDKRDGQPKATLVIARNAADAAACAAWWQATYGEGQLTSSAEVEAALEAHGKRINLL